jgi:hypothetical protein
VLFWSLISAFEASLIRIRHWEEEIWGTVQVNFLVDAAKLAMMVVQLAPLFVEYSSLTLLILETDHVMSTEVPGIHISLPIGDVIVTPTGKIVKAAAL